MTRVSHVLIAGDDMRLGTLTLTATLSAALLSGCSFIGGQPGTYKNPFAKQKSAQHGQYGANRHTQGQQGYGAQRCQISSPNQPIPRGCRPEQVTLSVGPAHGQMRGQQGGQAGYGGFPQEPNFGTPSYSQPEYTSGAYGSAVGQTAALAHHTGKKKRKPKLRGSLSLGAERSVGGELIDYSVRDDLNPAFGYNPQDYNEGFVEGSVADGLVTQTIFTANDLQAPNIFTPNSFETSSSPSISYDDAWATPASLKAGLEYIVSDKTTVFATGGYSYSEGNAGDVVSVDATLYRQETAQAYAPVLDGGGVAIPGAFVPAGAPTVNTTYIPNQRIATFAYDFSDLKRYDLEVGARHYLNPIVKSEGYRTVTPFVGASVGASHVNAVDFTSTQTQTFYQRAFDGETEGLTYAVPTAVNSRRLYDSAWLPQGQLNVGAEWQITPRTALALESGVRVQGARDYADFVNAAGETVSGAKGDMNISIPVTLRGSFNF
jgi:hypothetical protein